MSASNFYRADLVERVNFTDDLAMFRFRPEAEFTFKPGQYATLAVEHDGKLIQRPYSIVSSPYERFLEFFIELVQQGELTPRLWELKQGDNVLVRNRIVGAFVLDDKAGMKRHAMAATVTGIAPYVSMIRTHRMDLDRGGKVEHQFAVVQGASRAGEFGIYKAELDEIARQGWVHYVATVSRPWECPDWKGESGRVEDVLRKHIDNLGFDFTNSVGYACGHPQMIENVKGLLARARYPKSQIKDEKYFSLHSPES
jgi:ferredoxin--NADP+ reductase